MAVTGIPPKDISSDFPLSKREKGDKPRPGQPPKQGSAPKPPPPTITWFWAGFNWWKTTGCASDGRLAIQFQCSEIDSVVGLLSNPVSFATTPTPNVHYPFTATQSATPSLVNGYQLPWGLIGKSNLFPPTIVPTLPTGMGPPWGISGLATPCHPGGCACAGVAQSLLVNQFGTFNPINTPPPGLSIQVEFNLQNVVGHFLPLDPNVANGCYIQAMAGNPGWTCSNLGNNHFRWTLDLSTHYTISHTAPPIIVYLNLPAGIYTFNWDGIYTDVDGLGLVTHTIDNSSADFVVEADPVCDCSDPTKPFNQMPFAYRDSWPHWSFNNNYNPPLTHTIDQYNWLINVWGGNPNFNGSALPIGHNVQNMTANLDYPNQSTFCEYCRAWQDAGSTPNSWGDPLTMGSIPYRNYILGLSGSPANPQSNLQWLDATQNPYPVNMAGALTYSTFEPFATVVDAEDACDCCPLDAQGQYDYVGLNPGYHSDPIPPTGTWMGPV